MDFSTFIRNVVARTTTNQEFIDRLTDPESMALYEIAFTHKSVDPVNNYETLEFKGDVVLNCVAVIYLTKRFPKITDEGILSSMKHYVTEKSFFAKMAIKLGFDRYIKIIDIPEVRDQAISINEDVFEAFSGALFEMCEQKIFQNSGYAFITNFIEYLYKDEHIPTTKSELQKPRSLLKELWERSKLPKPKFKVQPANSFGVNEASLAIETLMTRNGCVAPPTFSAQLKAILDRIKPLKTTEDVFIVSHEPRMVDGKERNINIVTIKLGGRVIGFAEEYRMDEAKDKASEQALVALAKQGITVEGALEDLTREKRRFVDPLLAQFKAANPGLDFQIGVIKKSDKNSPAIVGYYINDGRGKYMLKLMERGDNPEKAEEVILRKLLKR